MGAGTGLGLLLPLSLMLAAVALHHGAHFLAVDFLAAIMPGLMLGVLALLVLGMLGGAVLRMVDGGGGSRLCRGKCSGCEKKVHLITP